MVELLVFGVGLILIGWALARALASRTAKRTVDETDVIDTVETPARQGRARSWRERDDERLAQEMLREAGGDCEFYFDDPPPPINHKGTFVFTGEFSAGKRKCGQLVEAHGGKVLQSVTAKTDCVVVGGFSPAYKHGAYGTKIEKAIGLRERTGAPVIVSEAEWRRQMEAT